MEIDTSKENIQPLRGGRNALQLGAALHAQRDADAQRTLQLQRQEYEAVINNYDGPDPLEPWFNYIQWVEQSFPKHGHEGQIDKLIKDCLTKFENDERYMQDRRYLRLWIKYIDYCNNPLEHYQLLYNRGIGITCSELYRAWACYCEEATDFVKAEQVYVLGLKSNAQPKEELEQAHMSFQICYAQRQLHDDSPTKRKAASALAETRLALTTLRTVKRRNIAVVSSQRTGDHIQSSFPGVMNPEAANHQPRSNVLPIVYVDKPGPSTFPGNYNPQTEQSGGPIQSLLQSCNTENQKEVGMWSNTGTKAEKYCISKKTSIAPLPFTPYVDEGIILSSNHLSYCRDDLTTFQVPLCVPDPADPTKIPMYNKNEVYKETDNGLVEFSMEEIRARRYLAKLTMPKLIQESEAEATNKPKGLVDIESNCQFNELNIEFDLEKVITQSNSVLNADDHISNIGADLPNGYIGCVKKDNQENNDKIIADFNDSLMANIHNDSITVHTKEALKELNLYGENETTSIVQTVESFPFEIREDHSMTMAAVKMNSANIPKHDLYNNVSDENLCKGIHYNKESNKYGKAQGIFVARDKIVLNAADQVNFDETSTQVFTFNVPSASTPYNSHFKKPQFVDSLKRPNVKSFNIGDGGNLANPMQSNLSQKESVLKTNNDASGVNDANQGGSDGLYPIMETTEEYRSGSSSSSSNLITRNTVFGHTTRESSSQPLSVINENTQDSHVNHDPSYHQYMESDVYGKKADNLAGIPAGVSQNRNMNYSINNESKVHAGIPQPVINHVNIHATPPYHTIDHQYHKTPNGVNKMNMQKNVATHYQSPNQSMGAASNNGYQLQHTSYQNTPAENFSNSFTTSQNSHVYSPPNYSNPQQNNVQNVIYQAPAQVQPGYHSPQPHHHQSYQQNSQLYMNSQHNYSPVQQNFINPQHSFQVTQRVYSNSTQQQIYVNSQQNASPNIQSSPHIAHAYSNMQPFHNASPNYVQNTHVQHNQSFPQHSYHNGTPNHISYHNQQNYSNMNQSHQQYHSNHAYNHPPQQNHLNKNQSVGSYDNVHNDQAHQPNFSIYRSPQNNAVNNPQLHYAINNISSQAQDDFSNGSSRQHNPPPNAIQNEYNVPNPVMANSQYPKSTPTNQKYVYQSPTSKLRSVRHELPNPSHKTNNVNSPTSIPGYSNQYLNFITNQPKSNANTPKSNGPSIAHKMHKKLYVSSPEQAHVSPTNEISITNMDKGGMHTTSSSRKNASHSMKEKNRDQSKRQLDFDSGTDTPEESQDYNFKEGRMSLYSQQSNRSPYIDSYQMDIDNENSSDCHTFKSNCSNNMISTQDIPRPATIEFPKLIDPFNIELCNSLLQYVKFPNRNHYQGYYEVKYVPKLQQGTIISVDQAKYSIEKQLGKGTFGSVCRGVDVYNREAVALKYQKPGHPWEYYICQEIKARITDPFLLPGYMDIRSAFLGDNASIFVSELSIYGSLLDVANKIKAATTKCIGELIVMLMTSEMLSIIHYLHKADIIHADIKPDNFLVMKVPQTVSRAPSLQLIDFGCAIDMSLFPQGTQFKKVISTDGFTCAEMRDGRPWTYQTDLYCLAGTVYVILMGNYMQTAYRGGQWTLEKKWPRYMKSTVWDKLFSTLLNIKDCDTIPDLLLLKDHLDDFLKDEDGNLSTQLRAFDHVLKSK